MKKFLRNINFGETAIRVISAIFLTSICGCSEYLPTKSSSQQLSAQELFKKYNDSIVRIHSMRNDGSKAKSGTGFAITTEDGPKIVTNKHITQNQDVIIIESEVGSWISSSRKEHTDQDICILPVEIPINIKPIAIETANNIEHGQKIFTIGHPLGMEIAIYEGMINSVNRGKLVFSAPLSEGASGSPMLTQNGEVIGICDSYVGGVGAQNYNLATALREGWDRDSYKEVTNKIDPYLSEYLKKISAIRKKIRDREDEMERLGEENSRVKEWVEQTQWTRKLFQQSAENACISFSAIDWSNLNSVEEIDIRQNEISLLNTSGANLRKTWEDHKKRVRQILPPAQGFEYIGIKESEDFVTSLEIVGDKLSQFLDSKKSNDKVGEKRDSKNTTGSISKGTKIGVDSELVLAIGTYEVAKKRFLDIGSP